MPFPSPRAKGRAPIHSSGSDSPLGHTVRVTGRKWLPHLWGKKKKLLTAQLSRVKTATAPAAGGGCISFFTKRQNPQLQNVESPMGEKQGAGRPPPPPPRGLWKGQSTDPGGRGTGGAVSPHRPPETATETACELPQPTRPPNIQVFKNREGKSTDVFKKRTKRDEQLEARGGDPGPACRGVSPRPQGQAALVGGAAETPPPTPGRSTRTWRKGKPVLHSVSHPREEGGQSPQARRSLDI